MGVLNKKEQVPLEIYLFVEYVVVCYDYLSFAAVCFRWISGYIVVNTDS